MSEIRSVSHVALFKVGVTNAVLRPGEFVTIKADGAHPRCSGPYDGVVVRGMGIRGDETFEAGEEIAIAMLNSGGESIITVNDRREAR